MSYNHSIIFGPIVSRRLGFSLGLDIIPAKTCSLDCVYCECGKTTLLTNERKEYISVVKIISELDGFLSGNLGKIDVITFAGSGEPLLNSGVGKIISHIKEKYPQFKIAFITNSILLTDKNAREEILAADFVLPSVDAMFEESFAKINRSAEGIGVNSVLEGLREFAKIYKGNLWVELFIIEGINDSTAELSAFKKYFEEIKPTLIQLNSLDRRGTCDWVKPASKKRLEEIQEFLAGAAQPLEIITREVKK